ncbi:MAG TPA: flagellar biosynthesis protein FlhB [Casimicrobiaceae bacterium]|nr:flagellar biosynthesis protein FlhB [Casimicrobiaceae bacterium]
MADEHDVERSFPATPRRLEQARERGQVARSRELATAGVALAAAAGFALFGPQLGATSVELVRQSLTLSRADVFAEARMLTGLADLGTAALVALMPILLVVLGATVLSPMLLSGWVLSPQALAPDFNRLNPRNGLANMFSSHGAAELVKAVVKCVLIGAIGWWTIHAGWDEMRALSGQSAVAGIAQTGRLITQALFALAGGLVVIALVDAPYQYWHYHRKLRMSREEIRQEMRESEGDPQLKARIRVLQRQAARRRMMAAVPGATVVVTNPTHYAVALQWSEGRMRAPRVVAKGAGLVALRIREIAAAHGVPLLEAPPLARALHRHVDVDAEIPGTLYAAVAQVLAWVHQLNAHREGRAAAPQAPEALEVPAALDPGAAAGDGEDDA